MASPTKTETEQTVQTNGGNEAVKQKEEDPTVKTLALATELFSKGSKSIEDGDYVDAVDCLSRALEIRVAHYGELASECAMAYYKYGCALLYKSQEESDPLGNVVPKDASASSSLKGKEENGKEEDGALKGVAKQDDLSPNNNNQEEEEEQGDNAKDQEDDNEGSDGEELAEADEDDSDLDLAWKMLDIARAIVEKCPEDKIEKVNVLAALGEVSMEREDFDTSFNDYLKALSILERLVEPDGRRIVELNFRICLVLEVWSKLEEAIPYCQKAISLCKSRLERLSEDVKSDLPEKTTDSDNGDKQVSAKAATDLPTSEEDEKEVLRGILSELEKKLEDLEHAVANPKSVFSEIMKMVASGSTSAEMSMSSTGSRSLFSDPGPLAAVSGGFDSPTVCTAATNSGVTHLGVVGRGIKRASLNPIEVEPSAKKPSLDPIPEKDGSSISVVDPPVEDSEISTK